MNISLDVRKEHLIGLAWSYENDEWVCKLRFENCEIILSSEQVGDIREPYENGK